MKNSRQNLDFMWNSQMDLMCPQKYYHENTTSLRVFQLRRHKIMKKHQTDPKQRNSLLKGRWRGGVSKMPMSSEIKTLKGFRLDGRC